MKKITLALFLTALSFASFSQKNSWAEAKKFHHFMSSTFHPAEEGNFKPLKEKCDSLDMAAIAWSKSPIPADYKEKETKEVLATLVKQTAGIKAAVKGNATDAELKKLITEAHDTFHKLVGECRKEEKH